MMICVLKNKKSKNREVFIPYFLILIFPFTFLEFLKG